MPKGKKDAPPPVEETFEKVDISSKDPRTVVLMLDSPEGLVQAKACEALLKYMQLAEKNIKELLGYDVLKRLTALLISQEKGLRAYAVMCLAACMSLSETRLKVRKMKMIPLLLKLMESDEEAMIHERTTFTVSCLAEEFSLKIDLNKEGAIAALLRLIHSPTPDTQRNSVKSLQLLTQHYQARATFLETENGLQSMLELLTSEYAILQEMALRTVNNCMLDVNGRNAFREIGGLEKIVQFIANKEYADLHVVALSVLERCLEDTENMQALQSSGCLNDLLNCIKSSTSSELKEKAALALSKAARNDLNCKILHEQNMEMVLLELLSHENNAVAGAACEGVASLAKLMSSRQRVGQNDGVSRMVNLFTCDSIETKASAAKGLCTVVADLPTNCILVGECDGVKSLIGLLSEDHALCVMYTAQCLSALSVDSKLRSQCVEQEVVTKLVDKLNHSDVDVLCACTEAIANLACDSETRAQFFKCGGVDSLIPLLSHVRKEVQRSACDALALCARNNEVATAAIQQGALNLLTEIGQSASRGTSTCQSALSQLLASNLSAKYKLTGRVDSSDIIRNGFYDIGPVREPGEKFLSLKELMERPLEVNAPVFYVNLIPPATPKLGDSEPSDISLNTKRSKSRSDKAKDAKLPKKKSTSDVTKEKQLPEDSAPSLVSLMEGIPSDPDLLSHIQHAKSEYNKCSLRTQIELLGQYVSDALGGPLENTSSFHYELDLGETQNSLKSNLVPIGSIRKGAHRHRALLFKVLCDQLGVSCTLVRGEYNRYWNEVLLPCESGGPTLRRCVVDLISHPGKVLPDGSPEATQYVRL